MRRLLIIILTNVWFNSNAQVYVLKGQLKNHANGKPVPYASIWIKDSSYGVASNDEGKFELPLSGELLKDSLNISSLGFKTYKEKIENLLNKDFLIINLTETVYQLKEITIKDVPTDTILLRAIQRIPDHFAGSIPLKLEYFYRSVSRQDDRCVYLVESAFLLTLKSDRENAIGSFKLKYRAARHSANHKKGPLSRPFITPNVIFTWKIPLNNVDNLKKLIKKKAWVYDMEYADMDNETVYIITVTVNPSWYPGNAAIRGRDWIGNYVFYIRARDYAILRIDYGAGEYAKRIQPEGIPPHLRLEAAEDGTLIFKELKGRFYPHYYQVVVDYTWYEAESGTLIVKGFEKNEAIVQKPTGNAQQDLLSIKTHRDYSIPSTKYDSVFWNSYLLKDQIPLESKVIEDLEKHSNVSIQQQFITSGINK
jgi:hypothetical protein